MDETDIKVNGITTIERWTNKEIKLTLYSLISVIIKLQTIF